MRLKQIIIENFRGYQAETSVLVDECLTAFIGRNDVGKSTILEALEIFFNSEIVKLEPSDLNVNARSRIVTIGCIFDQLPNEIVIDEKFPTSFATEYLTNADGDLEIRKRFIVGTTVRGPTTYLRANHPSANGLDNLHSQKIEDLRRTGASLGVAEHVEDKRVASLWRKAIWRTSADGVLQIVDLDVTKLEGDSKSIYSKIQSMLPTYALFKADRESSDADPEAKNPMQIAVKQAKKDLQGEIDTLQEKIEAAVMDVANRTLEKVRDMDPGLASQLTPKFRDPPKWTFNFTLDGDHGIPINKRGSGVRRLILLNFFRAEAEKKRVDTHAPRLIYAVEEPETSQHPNYQIMLIQSLLRLSQRDECQLLVTTHVPGLAGMLPTGAIRFVEKSDTDTPVVSSGTDDVIEKAAASLGVLADSDVATAKAILLVEGHSDVLFVNHSAVALKESGHLAHTLSEKGIATIPIGGCGNLKHWVTQRLAEQLHKNWAVLIDSDRGEPIQYERNQKKIQEVRDAGKLAITTRKREPENYIDPAIVREVSGVEVTYTEEEDAKTIIASATNTRRDDVLGRFWPRMSAERILEQSRYESNGTERFEILDILSEILGIC